MKKFGILSILFLLFSLIGVLYLVKNNQDIRNKAAPGDYNGGSLCNGYINNYCSQYGVTATLSKCPNQWESSCWNSQTIKGTSLCMDKNFCGSQQLDVYYNDGGSCWVDYWDYSCDAPTATPIPPTNTPIPTNTPTPTGTPKPTNTPTPTNTPKPTATGTPEPTATNTPIPPTNTPIPTQVITEGPSPTRIILPESGVEFPSQILTLVGGIITLLGFLILL
ncbi:MAG TPA: hypothetical protein PKI92_00120 [Candidatus Woesebacteria bacterium]|nr:hypothetical protein [Candidatus Woesebacteria bacterium]